MRQINHATVSDQGLLIITGRDDKMMAAQKKGLDFAIVQGGDFSIAGSQKRCRSFFRLSKIPKMANGQRYDHIEVYGADNVIRNDDPFRTAHGEIGECSLGQFIPMEGISMKVAILAGGLGTRLSEETTLKPKPMVEIGGQPILWHIMNIYAAYGFSEFAVALGYLGHIVKSYFIDYYYRHNSLSIQLQNGNVQVHDGVRENWTVHLVETGPRTETGGRVKRLAPWIGNQTFMLTYGDGVANIDIADLLAFHRRHGKLATITAVRPPARFGGLGFDGDLVARFEEKPQIGEGWINGGFFVLEPEVLEYIDGDSTLWEREPLERLAKEGQLVAYRHGGFWQCMDTLRDVRLLETLWEEGRAPWKVWP